MKLETFFEKFDQFADAPDAVAKMRELILRLAMQGKLVSQNPRDKPADSLVVELKAEVGDKNSRRTAPLPPIAPDEIPFELPAGWVWERLGNIGETNIGLTYSPQDVSDVGTPVLRSSNVQNGKLDFDDLVRVTCEPKQSVMVQDGDLLICARNGSRALVGKVALIENLKEPAAFGAFMAIFRSRVNRFLYHFICSPLFRRMIDEVNTTTINQITQNNLRSTLAPIPPLAEQKRIVAKVDELMALCDRLEAQQQERETRHAALARASLARFADAPTPANLSFLFHPSYAIPPADLRKSILTLAVQGKLVPQDPNDEPAEELFARIERTKEKLIKERTIKRVSIEANPSGEECESLPPGWLWTRLGHSFDVRDGTHDTPKYTTDGFPLITSKNIYSGSLLFEGANLISEKDHRQISERSRVERWDILFAMIGSIGNPVIVDTDREFSIKNVALFKYYSAADAEPRFLLLYLKLVAEEMKAKAAGAVQSFVSLGFLRNYLFPLPPLAEQRRIVAKVDHLMALVDALETQLAASHATAANLLSALVAELTAA